MANKWIYTEDMGREQFYIADTDKGLRFVVLDKYGIANIFDSMDALSCYFRDDLDGLPRQCVEPYETGIEGVDFIDHYLKIEEV